MAKRQELLSKELNKTSEASSLVEKFHSAECYGLLGEIGFLSDEQVALMLDKGKFSERRNRKLEALQKIIYAKIATLEGNFAFAMELYDEVMIKIKVLKQGAQQDSALAYFYYEYAGFMYRVGDLSAALMYLEKARGVASSNKIKQMISYQLMVIQGDSLKKSALKKWLQSIAYFNKYEMQVMEAQAHYDLALYFNAQENVADAAAHLELAHEMAGAEGYMYISSSVEFIRGCMLVKQDRMSEAIGYFQGLIERSSSEYFKTRLHLKLAELFKQTEQDEQALESAKASMEISQRFAMQSELADASLILGRLYHRSKKDITRAYFYFQQAYGSVMLLTKRGVLLDSKRSAIVDAYVDFLEEHFPGDVTESANEDLFAFSKALNWVRIKDLFHYNLFLYHYMNTGVGNKTLEALDFPASSFYSATERLRSRGITFPNFRRNDVDVPSENYVEGLQQYSRLHREKTWVEINERFEKDMLAYHYKLNNYNKKLLAKHLELAYSGIVNRTKYLTAGQD